MKRMVKVNVFSLFVLIMLHCHAVYAQSIEITAPNGGESWQLGSIQSITWINLSFDSRSTVTLELLKDGIEIGEIASDIRIDSLSYSWRVGDYRGGTVSPGTGYSIRITVDCFIHDERRGSTTDTSNSSFTIVAVDSGTTPLEIRKIEIPAIITISQPNGGERWPFGSTQTIKWLALATTGNIRILLSKDGTTVKTIATDIPVSAKSYSWAIPGSTGEEVRRVYLDGRREDGGATSVTGLKVVIESLSSPGLKDESNGTFTLYIPGSITVTEPGATTFVGVGFPSVIRWEKSGDMGTRVRIDLYKDGRKVETIQNSTENDGQYSWNVPLRHIGSGFQIVVETLDLVPVRGQSQIFQIQGLKR